MARQGVRWLVWAVVLVAVVVLAGVLVTIRDREAGHPTGVPPAPTSTVPPAPAEPVLAVKVGNVVEARPQSGLGAADVIYVEPVEGGLTRLVAVYAGDPPNEVGPVRSARRTDLDLLAQWGKPVLAYSGAAPELLPALHAANIINADPTGYRTEVRLPVAPALGPTTRIAQPVAAAVELTKDALRANGFGVLSEIDVHAVPRDRIGAELEDYAILGACEPNLAKRALDVDRQVGLLLPCTVVVRADGAGDLIPIATEARARLDAALNTDSGTSTVVTGGNDEAR